jgi:hypothetical protein
MNPKSGSNATLKDLAKTKREREALDGKSLDDLAEELGQNDPAAPKRRQ